MRQKYHVEWSDVIVEAHGLLFDLIVFGILLAVYDALKNAKEEEERNDAEIKRNISRYIEEIDDYRSWKDDEAKFRIIGNIKRLNRLGVNNINLEDCYFENGSLNNLNLEESNLKRANLKLASLVNINLSKANLRGAILAQTNFSGIENNQNIGANLEGANLIYVRGYNVFLSFSNLKECSFQGADLAKASFFAQI